METIRGKREGSCLYVYKDFTYTVDKRYSFIYRCTKRHVTHCRGILVKSGDSFYLKTEHNHSGCSYIVDIFKLKQEMLLMAKNTFISYKDIFDDVCRQNPSAAAHISYSSMRSMLFRERIKSWPILPADMPSLQNVLQYYEPTKFIYKGCVISEDNKRAFIFSSDKLLEALDNSSELFMDGTFSTVPKIPNFEQLYSIHIRYADKGIAALFILCESRTSSLYKAMWKEIMKLAPKLENNLQFVMSDYEKAAMNTVREQFPRASVHGCWFHYTQALSRKWKYLGLSEAPSMLLAVAKALPLIPDTMFEDAFLLMENIMAKLYKQYSAIFLFMTYLKKTWLPIASIVSTYKNPIRTNNLVESFHSRISHKFAASSSNLWSFLENILKLIKDEEINFNRLLLGQRVRTIRSRYFKERDIKIGQSQDDLVNGRLSLRQFLYMFIDDTEKIQCQEILREENYKDANRENTCLNIREDSENYDANEDCIDSISISNANNSDSSIKKPTCHELKIVLQRVDEMQKRQPFSNISNTSKYSETSRQLRSRYKTKKN